MFRPKQCLGRDELRIGYAEDHLALLAGRGREFESKLTATTATFKQWHAYRSLYAQ